MESAVADVLPDWTLLPEDVLVTVMCELDVPSLIRAGAVCAPWHSAYATFRRLRLPSPRQPPCLLYSCDAAATALYCPSTGANFRIPFRGLSPIGSAQGWLVVADEVSNLHLTNPLTGGRVALPPITTLLGFQEGTCFDEHGNLAYNYQEPGEATFIDAIPVGEAADCTYERAVLSCAPSSAASVCVVLLLHTPNRELSYARPGDERWTWIPPGDGVTCLQRRNFYCNATYNDNDGLFYVVHFLDSIYSLDLNGPSPVVTRIIPELRCSALHSHYRYLIHAPWGDLLLASRFRDESDPSVEICTEELQLYRIDSHGQKLVKLEEGLPHHALFLGRNGPLCLRVTDFSRMKPNCAYITDDADIEFMIYFKQAKRDIGVWDIERQRLQSFDEDSNLKLPWLNWPLPIWITPSLL